MTTYTWADNIDTITNEFLTLAEKLSGRDLNWKPDGDSWSIAQIIRFNESCFPAFDLIVPHEQRHLNQATEIVNLLHSRD